MHSYWSRTLHLVLFNTAIILPNSYRYVKTFVFIRDLLALNLFISTETNEVWPRGVKNQTTSHVWVFNKCHKKLFQKVQLREKNISTVTISAHPLQMNDINVFKRCNKSLQVSLFYLSFTSTLGPGGVRRTSKRFSSSFQNRRSISDMAVSTGARKFVFNSSRVIKFLVTYHVSLQEDMWQIVDNKGYPVFNPLVRIAIKEANSHSLSLTGGFVSHW